MALDGGMAQRSRERFRAVGLPDVKAVPAACERKGVLHRDIKPANVLISPEASPKLADFNVSFQGGRDDEDPEDEKLITHALLRKQAENDAKLLENRIKLLKLEEEKAKKKTSKGKSRKKKVA